MRALLVMFLTAVFLYGSNSDVAGKKIVDKEIKKVMICETQSFRIGVDTKSGSLSLIERKTVKENKLWMSEPVSISIRNEQSGEIFLPSVNRIDKSADEIAIHNYYGMKKGKRKPTWIMKSIDRWTMTDDKLILEFKCEGTEQQTGYEINIEFPVLSKDYYVFTPTERGLMSVSENPSFKPVVYGSTGYSAEWRYYVLPLVSVFDLKSDNAITIALPPNTNIPHLQVEWSDMKTLKLHLGHRGMGNQKSSSLKLLFYFHKADYRSVIKTYSDNFPEYFQPVIPAGKHEGAFWYHHIHNRPDFAEMSRQDVRFIWTSFWFPYLGEFLPAETEWYPYTYAKSFDQVVWGEKISDTRIIHFADTLSQHGIGTFAYFSLTEYGSGGGQYGDRKEVAAKLQNNFAADLLKLENDKPVTTWDGSMVMNPRKDSHYNAHLRVQAKRHIRLYNIEGFMVDRLDWASPDKKDNPTGCDFGHSDGFTMIGNRPVENMMVPVGDALQELCTLAHKAGRKVYVNQFWRVELLRNVDAHVHEFDYVRGLGYLSPFRPSAAWNSNNYQGKDLIQFEAQLKRRLQFALFPHLITHEFKIAQQSPNAKAADMLEIFTPLFSLFHGKKQILEPHCISVTGSNDVNLFVNGDGYYIAPVTSRFRFTCKGSTARDSITVTLNVPDAPELKWAQVYSTDLKPYKASVSIKGNTAIISAGQHVANSVIVIGKGVEPEINADSLGSVEKIRQQFIADRKYEELVTEKPQLLPVKRALIKIHGLHVGEEGKVIVYSDGKKLGELPVRSTGPMSAGYTNTGSDEYKRSSTSFELSLIDNKLPESLPLIQLLCGDEGTWFVPENIELLAVQADGKSLRVAEWNPDFKSGIRDHGSERFSPPPVGSNINVGLQWCKPVEMSL